MHAATCCGTRPPTSMAVRLVLVLSASARLYARLATSDWPPGARLAAGSSAMSSARRRRPTFVRTISVTAAMPSGPSGEPCDGSVAVTVTVTGTVTVTFTLKGADHLRHRRDAVRSEQSSESSTRIQRNKGEGLLRVPAQERLCVQELSLRVRVVRVQQRLDIRNTRGESRLSCCHLDVDVVEGGMICDAKRQVEDALRDGTVRHVQLLQNGKPCLEGVRDLVHAVLSEQVVAQHEPLQHARGLLGRPAEQELYPSGGNLKAQHSISSEACQG
eukprot:748840-Prorocentrum_minimum.AAC.1